MNAFKSFMIRNRHLAALTIGISIIFISVFTILAVCFLDTPKTEASTYPDNTSMDYTSQSIPTQSKDEADTSKKSEISIDDTTEETTTVRETLPSEELPYLIMVNRVMNCVTVYGKDSTGQFTIPVKAMTCSVGREGHETPLGTYTTSDQFRWAVMADGTRAQYVYRFKGSYLFHSIPYYSASKDDLETEEFNKLGTAASLGCVRLCVADVKWIYENCDINTTVIIYDDPSSPGPLGKPDTIKIPLDSPYKGWDPTDPDPANPWHNFSATIEANEKNITITKGSSTEALLSKFTIKDTCGNEIPEKATIEGNYNLNIAGTYTITVNVTDAIGSTASLEVTISVTNEAPAPTTTEATTETTIQNTTSTDEASSQTDTTTSDTTTSDTTTSETTTNETDTTEPPVITTVQEDLSE